MKDKLDGRDDTYKKCRTKINSMIKKYDLVDIWPKKH